MVLPVAGVAGTSPTWALAGATGAGSPAAAGRAGGGDFAAAMLDGVEQVQQLHARADQLAVQAATGDLTDAHDYTVAASQAALATEMTVALRNKALEAFTEIMRMQV
jgi:flagellar hook-basal body complex protein FliE